eukprot:SAG31_NODE_6837_length_1874_cov_1.677746_2_plen_375_part_00
MYNEVLRSTNVELSKPGQIVRAILEALGFPPTTQDVEDCLTYVEAFAQIDAKEAMQLGDEIQGKLEQLVETQNSGKQTEDLQTDLMRLKANLLPERAFVAWCKQSVFGSSISERLVQAVFAAVLEKRNAFLGELPGLRQEEWGFKPTEIGTILPSLKVLKQPAEAFVKVELRNLWQRRLADCSKDTNDEQVPRSDDSDPIKDAEADPPLAFVPLGPGTDEDDVALGKASVLRVGEQLLANMAKLYLANALPADCDSAAWLTKKTSGPEEDKRLQSTAFEVVSRRLKAYVRHRQDPVRAERERAADAEAELRQAAVREWLKSPDLGLDDQIPDDITPLDIAEEVVRTELESYLDTQLVPVITNFVGHSNLLCTSN